MECRALERGSQNRGRSKGGAKKGLATTLLQCPSPSATIKMHVVACSDKLSGLRGVILHQLQQKVFFEDLLSCFELKLVAGSRFQLAMHDFAVVGSRPTTDQPKKLQLVVDTAFYHCPLHRHTEHKTHQHPRAQTEKARLATIRLISEYLHQALFKA